MPFLVNTGEGILDFGIPINMITRQTHDGKQQLITRQLITDHASFPFRFQHPGPLLNSLG